MTRLPHVLQLVDSIDYVRANCFQHQLLEAIRRKADVRLVTLADLRSTKAPQADMIVSCLRQRTIHQNLDALQRYLDGQAVVVYDQDPWHAYMDDSPYKGVYDRIAATLNLRFIAVTTQWWADLISSRDIPSRFVKMWMSPGYCVRGPAYVDRPTNLGFIGSVHPHRKRLFNEMTRQGHPVSVSGGHDYAGYLNALHDVRTYVHSEDCELIVDGQVHNLNVGLWAREVEVGARGCFSVRNWGSEHATYLVPEIRNTFLYHDVSELPNILRTIDTMDPAERQTRLDDTVRYIRDVDEWGKTAQVLVNG